MTSSELPSILFAISSLIILPPIFFIFKYRKDVPISIRSPILIIFNLISLFLMSAVFFVYEILISLKTVNMDYYCDYFVAHYLEFHIMLKIPFYIRMHRTCRILEYEKFSKENPELSKVTKKEFNEAFYLKTYFLIITFAFLIRIIMIVVIENVNNVTELSNIMVPFNFDRCVKKKGNIKVNSDPNSIFWIFFDFIDQMTLITYAFKLFKLDNCHKYLLKIEMWSFIVVWMFYPETSRILQFSSLEDYMTKTDISYMSIFYTVLTALTVGYIPLISMYLFTKRENEKGLVSDMCRSTQIYSNIENRLSLQDYDKSQALKINEELYDKMFVYALQSQDPTLTTNMLFFFKDEEEIHIEYNKLSLNQLQDKYQIVYNKYFKENLGRYVNFPNHIHKSCIQNLLKIKSDKVKMRVYVTAVDYVVQYFKGIKMPYFSSSLNDISVSF